jgi:tripartite-type tricarboxylate transporter receptor subunit TctC
MRQAPAVPTFRESGMDVNAGVWFALFAPSGTPPAAISRLSAASQEWPRQQNVIEAAEKLAMDLVGSGPAELVRVIQDDVAARAEAARIGKIQPQ